MKGKYINPKVTGFELPGITGQHYEVRVPDTLDLAEMAENLIHAMTKPTDPQADYEVYWWVIFGTKPPRMVHQFSDQVQFYVMGNLPLMRIISGSKEGMEEERGFISGTIKNVGKDGLFYNLPWARPWTVVMDQSFAFADKPPEGKPFASLLQSTMYLYMLNMYGQLSSDRGWINAARRCADSLIQYAVDKGEFAYFHKWQYEPGEPPSDGPIPGDRMRGIADIFSMYSLLQLYYLTGYEPAGKLARKMLNYYTNYWISIDKNGKFIETWPGVLYSGFPIWSSLVPLDWGLSTGDPTMIEIAKQNFEKYLPYIETLTGYLPEAIYTSEPSTKHTAESCFLAYVVQNALLLSISGAGDYWEYVDRWIRNQFAEAQLKSINWIEPMLKDKPVVPGQPYSTTERVAERNLGAFAGFMQFNDWYGGNVHPCAVTSGGTAIQHCCTFRSATAIYNVWNNILQYESGNLRLNLLLNRASKWADVDSYIPYEGRVDVKIKRPLNLSVRIPEWVQTCEVRASVNGKNFPVTFKSRYAQIGQVTSNQTVTLTFPISERKEQVSVQGQKYTLTIRGNTVVDIDPPGQFCPVYQRAHYREGITRWRKTNRFIADNTLKEPHVLSL